MNIHLASRLPHLAFSSTRKVCEGHTSVLHHLQRKRMTA